MRKMHLKLWHISPHDDVATATTRPRPPNTLPACLTLPTQHTQAHYRDYGKMTYARCAFVIHNMAHQGRGPFVESEHLELNEEYRERFRLYDPIGGEHMNVMKAGLECAHRLVAVSNGYAWECQTVEGGWGLHEVIKVNNWKLRGIVNGIDYKEWNPICDEFLTVRGAGVSGRGADGPCARHPDGTRTLTWLGIAAAATGCGGWRGWAQLPRARLRIPRAYPRPTRSRWHLVTLSPAPQTDGYAHYDVDTLAEGKAKCKAALQKELGLPVDPDAPMLGFIGRLDYQKGVDLIRDNYDYIMGEKCQLVMLGSGRQDLEDALRDMENRCGGRASGGWRAGKGDGPLRET